MSAGQAARQPLVQLDVFALSPERM